LTEADLADLGVHRIAVPVPFPQAGGPVNVYLVEERGGGYLLFDAGLGSPEAQAAIDEGFRRLGRRFTEISRIVVSHGHVDHYGAARWIQERHGGSIPVYAHRDDHAKITETGRRWKELAPLYAAHLATLGVPPDVLASIAREGERSLGLARRLVEVNDLDEGAVLETRHLRLEVLHMPGHTPGLVCLYDRDRRLFFSDDHLLEKVSPNPLIDLGPDGRAGWFRPLVSYERNVRRLHALEVDLVLPGHAEPFTGHRAVVERLLAFYQKRQARLAGLVGDGSPSVYELATRLFPRARAGEVFLTVSETVANLEVLEERGVLRREEAGGVTRFLRAGAA